MGQEQGLGTIHGWGFVLHANGTFVGGSGIGTHVLGHEVAGMALAE